MILFRRSELKVRYSMEQTENGKEIGHLRDLNSHVRFHELPNDISMAWIGVEPGEHFTSLAHPSDSYFILQKGTAQLEGTLAQEVASGDFLHIPKNNFHHFAMNNEEGFEGLSFYFGHEPLFSEEKVPLFDKSLVQGKVEPITLVRRSEKCFRDYDRLLPSGYRARWIYVKENKIEKYEYQGPTYIINFDGRCKIAGEHKDLEMLSQDIMYFDHADTLQFSTLRKSTLLSIERVDPEVELEGLS